MGNVREWSFVKDMNYDGSATISDVWLWFAWLYFYPGDLFLYVLMTRYAALATFFEITTESYGGAFSGLFSFFFWIMAIVVLVIIGVIDEKLGALVQKQREHLNNKAS